MFNHNLVPITGLKTASENREGGPHFTNILFADINVTTSHKFHSIQLLDLPVLHLSIYMITRQTSILTSYTLALAT